MYQSFEQLDVWKKATAVAVKIVAALKDSKDYAIKDQMTRAAVSIASNIAEGSERNSYKEYIHFLHIAKGSAAELRTQLIIAHEVGLVDAALFEQMTPELVEISKMLHGLIKSIHSQNT